jgi:hypothetical protein
MWTIIYVLVAVLAILLLLVLLLLVPVVIMARLLKALDYIICREEPTDRPRDVEAADRFLHSPE